MQSTLLKVLACNIGGGDVHGSFFSNGVPLDVFAIRRLSTVVWQRDILLPTATVSPHSRRRFHVAQTSGSGVESSDVNTLQS